MVGSRFGPRLARHPARAGAWVERCPGRPGTGSIPSPATRPAEEVAIPPAHPWRNGIRAFTFGRKRARTVAPRRGLRAELNEQGTDDSGGKLSGTVADSLGPCPRVGAHNTLPLPTRQPSNHAFFPDPPCRHASRSTAVRALSRREASGRPRASSANVEAWAFGCRLACNANATLRSWKAPGREAPNTTARGFR